MNIRFKKGNSGKPRGAKNKTTLLKERIGLDNWQSLELYLNNEGLNKLQDELNSLKGKDYIQCYTRLLEYFKPKLSSLNAEVKPVKDFSNFTIEFC